MGFSSIAWAPQAANATVILEGSDAIGLHCSLGSSGACTYRDQAWSAIGGASALPIAVVGTPAGSPIGSGTHGVMDFTDLSTAGNLNQYVAIYFVAGGGCCSSDPGDMAGRTADVLAYSASHTVMIENYDGNSGWDFLTGGSGNKAFVAGYNGGLPGPGCTDGETVTPAGTTNGFTQPPSLGCWTHQAYAETHFAALGFTESFFNADPAFAAANPGYGDFSSLLSNGNTITGGTPEPSTWAMMVLGFAAVSLAGYRASRKSVAGAAA